MRRVIAAFLFIALTAALGGAAQAADAVIAKVKGDVYFRAAGSDKYARAKGGEELIFGDRVRTGAGAVAQIVLPERGAILVREDSSFVLEGDTDKTLLNFRLGEFLIGLRKTLEAGQSFRVRTPAAVAAVRGTLFWGKSGADKTTTYAGLGHVIEVTAQGKTVAVAAGQTVAVPFGSAPSEPKPHGIPMSYWANFAVGDDLQGLGELIDNPPAPKPR